MNFGTMFLDSYISPFRLSNVSGTKSNVLNSGSAVVPFGGFTGSKAMAEDVDEDELCPDSIISVSSPSLPGYLARIVLRLVPRGDDPDAPSSCPGSGLL